MILLRLFLLVTVCSACVGCSTTGSHQTAKAAKNCTLACPVQLEGSY
jgi:hypothetical protein